MKVIDLYNKIANGEELPKLIKYDGEEYKITKILLEDNNYYFNYINEDMGCIFPMNTNHLNDTVEILEEQKKIPEKLDISHDGNHCYLQITKDIKSVLTDSEALVINKINKIIDYLESKGE